MMVGLYFDLRRFVVVTKVDELFIGKCRNKEKTCLYRENLL